MHVSHLICQLTLSELAPYRVMQNAECKMQNCEHIAQFCILTFAFCIPPGLPGLHRADPSTPLDEQSSIVAAQYSIALWWSQSIELSNRLARLPLDMPDAILCPMPSFNTAD